VSPFSRAWLVITTALFLAACGDDGGEVDAATDAGADGDAGAFAAPAIPWLEADVPPIAPPILTPCPAGWREVTDGEWVTCDPYPEGGALTCGVGEAHFVGETGCAPVGEPCPSGDFAEGLPTDGTVVYVRAGGPAGDGTLATPFESLSRVNWSSLASGSTVALARGSYEGSLPLKSGVRVVGACAAETFLTGLDAPVSAVVTVTSSGDPAVIENLTILDPPQTGCIVRDAGRGLRLLGVVIDGAQTFGLAGSSGTIDAERIVVQNTRRTAGSRSTGVYAGSGATVTIDRAVIADNAEDGLISDEVGTSLVVTNTATRGNGLLGLSAIRGASASATGAVLEGEGEVAVFTREGSSIDLTDVVIRDTRSGSTRSEGSAIIVAGDAHVTLSRAVLERNRTAAVNAHGDDDRPTLTMSDVVIRDTLPRERDGLFGRAIAAQAGGEIDAARVVLLRNPQGAYSGGEGSVLTLTDLVVRDTRAIDDSSIGGRALSAELGGHLDVSSALLADNEEFSVFAGSPGTLVALSDTRIRDTHPRRTDDKFGVAIVVQEGAEVEASRVIATGQSDLGVFASHEGAVLALTDVVVRGTESQVASGEFGHGVQVQTGAAATLTRVRIEDSRGAGLMATGGAAVTLDSVAVVDVGTWRCAADTCPDTTFGHGVSIVNSTVSANDFLFSNAEVCGVFLSSAAEVDLSMGAVTDTSIGVCLQVDSYDVSRLQNMVMYERNGVNLDATSLPVPPAIDEAGF